MNPLQRVSARLSRVIKHIEQQTLKLEKGCEEEVRLSHYKEILLDTINFLQEQPISKQNKELWKNVPPVIIHIRNT